MFSQGAGAIHMLTPPSSSGSLAPSPGQVCGVPVSPDSSPGASKPCSPTTPTGSAACLELSVVLLSNDLLVYVIVL